MGEQGKQVERICIIQRLERYAREDPLQYPLTQQETGNPLIVPYFSP